MCTPMQAMKSRRMRVQMQWLLVVSLLSAVRGDPRMLSHSDPAAAAAVGGLGSNCADYFSTSCASWASGGQCRSNPSYMHRE